MSRNGERFFHLGAHNFKWKRVGVGQEAANWGRTEQKGKKTKSSWLGKEQHMTFVKGCENSLTHLLRKSHTGNQKTRSRPEELRSWLSLTNHVSARGKLLPPHQWDGDRESEDLHMCERVTQICQFWLSTKGWVFYPKVHTIQNSQLLSQEGKYWWVITHLGSTQKGCVSLRWEREGKLQPFPTLSILLDNITPKGKQAQSALEAKLPP